MKLQEIIKARKLILSVADNIFKDAVVKVISKSKGEFEQGSGVVLKNGKILTAAHVVTDEINGVPADEVFVCVDDPKNIKDCLPVTVVSIQLGNRKTDDYVDLALLESENAKGKPYATLALIAPKVGDKVTLKGYDGRDMDEESQANGKVIQRDTKYFRVEPGLWSGSSGGGAFKGNELQGIISTMNLDPNDRKTPISQKLITPKMIRAFLSTGLPEQYDLTTEEGQAKVAHIKQYPEVKRINVPVPHKIWNLPPKTK